MEIKKIIGTREKAFYPEEVYDKLFALKEMSVSMLTKLNGEGLYDNYLDTLTNGYQLIFEDLLTELDQVAFDGKMEDTTIGKDTITEEDLKKVGCFNKKEVTNGEHN